MWGEVLSVGGRLDKGNRWARPGAKKRRKAIGQRKPSAENRDELEALKRQAYEDEVARIPIEGKFGNCKGTLARVMAKLRSNSPSSKIFLR